MSKYSRKQRPARGGHFKIWQTLFKPQETAISELQPYWEIMANMKKAPTNGKEMMRIRFECYWEGREYAEAFNRRQLAKDKK